MGFVCILFFPINSVNGPVTVTMLQYTVLYSHYSIIKSLYAKISYPLVLEVLSKTTRLVLLDSLLQECFICKMENARLLVGLIERLWK